MKIEVINNFYLRRNNPTSSTADIWFIHGFGESGLSFQEAFSSNLSKKYNLFCPDFPGFGATPPADGNSDLKTSLRIGRKLIETVSANRKIVVVGHSLGGILGTWICRELASKVVVYINVEGNLTKSESSFSSQVDKITSAKLAHKMLLTRVWEKAEKDLAYQRYYASVRFADPNSLKAWAKSSVRYTGVKVSGAEYAKLRCKKIYLWGENSLSEANRRFITSNNLANQELKHCGHWPMIDQPKLFYRLIEKFCVEGAPSLPL